MSRVEMKRVVWAIDPQLGTDDIIEPPRTFRRRTALWAWQVGAHYTIR